MSSITFDLVIPAAGLGKRMNTDVPKPFIRIHEMDILEHTLRAFDRQPIKRVVIATDLIWFERVKAYPFFKNQPHLELFLCEGGVERHNTVLNALEHCVSPFVCVHDAVRPFVSSNLITQLFNTSVQKGSAIPGIVPRDTVKRISMDTVEQTLDRSKLILVQTPQFFNSTIYNAALQQLNGNQLYTDDASIVESAGYNVYWVEGERDNIKITYAEDLQLAENKLSV